MAKSIFEECFKNYEITNPWTVNKSKTKYFSAKEVALVESAVVVSGDYGLSCKVKRKDGVISFIALSRDSKMTPGEIVDMSQCRLLCLERDGDDDIWRLEEID